MIWTEYALLFLATVTASAAVGVLREARRVVSAVTDNSRRSERNRERSLGNRRWLRKYGPRILRDTDDEYRPPHEHDPNDESTDGGQTSG